MRLSDAAIRKTKRDPLKTVRLYDGDGLRLLVPPAGKLQWHFDYRHAGKRKTLSLGTYPEVTLSRARDLRLEARRQVAAGIDPAQERRSAKRLAAGGALTFRALADEWIARQQDRWSAATLEKAHVHVGMAVRALGALAVTDVTPLRLLDALRPIEARGHIETAHRVRSRVGEIMRYGIATGRAERDPSADLRGALKPIVSTPRAAVTAPEAIGRLMRALRSMEGSPSVRVALNLLPLVMTRPGELRQAQWPEFDLQATAPLWRIPAERMKMREPHLVPLSKQAAAWLRELWEVTGPRDGDEGPAYVFPSRLKRREPIGENTLNVAMWRLGYDSETATPHGFRAMASTRLHEMGWKSAVIEAQLAHADPNQVRAVYNRALYLDERRAMLQAWADELDRLAQAPVR